MTSTSNNASNATRKLSDDVLQGAEQAVESTRSFANDSLDKAGDKVRDLRRDMDPLVEQITSKVQQLASRGAEYANDARYRARQQISHYADVTGRYVSEQPMRSVLIAAATGAAIAAAIIIASRSDSDSGRNRY